MKTTFSLIFLSIACLSVIGSAQPLLSDPEEYFGGSDAEAYRDWVEESASEYPSSIFLSSADNVNDGVAVHWRLDETRIYLAVAARATGWVGFGFSEAGGMQGADVILFEAASPNKLRDSYILAERVPFTDECQDWTLTFSSTADGFLIFEAHRLRDTFDSQDRNIVPDVGVFQPPSRVIAAWGDSEAVSYHGPHNARGAINWFSTEADETVLFQEQMNLQAEGSFEVAASEFLVPPVDTEYQPFCASWSDIVAQGVPDVDGVSIVGFEPIVDERARAHVHHFTVYASFQTNEGVDCDFEAGAYQHLTYVWAPGEGSLALPEDVGSPIGPGSFQSFQLEIHYDNPDLVEGVLDSSGVRFYYTTQPREHELGVLQVGDPFVALFGVPVSENPGLVEHSFECPGSCSAHVQDEPITIVREHLHMHASGESMRNELVRDGEVVHTGRVDFFDFDQQGNPLVNQEPFQVHPGDSFRTVCNYRSRGDEIFGLSSQEEMCIAFLFYYPRLELDGAFSYVCGLGLPSTCESTYETRELEEDSQLERVFGLPSEDGICPMVEEVASTQATKTDGSETSGAKQQAGQWSFAVLLLFVAGATL